MHWAGFDLSQPRVMGVINTTPDSFSDGGDYLNVAAAVRRAEDMCKAGATIIDIGGESTRPGAIQPSIEEEINRVVPVIRAAAPIAAKYKAKISIDARRAAAAAAIEAGAEIVNDISALTHDGEALTFIAEKQLPVVLGHMQGEPHSMQQNPAYDDIVREVYDYLAARIAACIQAGLARESICVDPGIGFGKTTAHNIALLQHLNEFKKLGVPVLVGLSRKRMIGEITGAENPKDRLAGSLAGGIFAVARGANILRVHDVRETIEALKMWQALADIADEIY